MMMIMLMRKERPVNLVNIDHGKREVQILIIYIAPKGD